ncbi:VOC domain-containing protein [Frankia sp. AiPs1]|uniref:VOC family protein n=1 Tax=Frankia sp. AiPa1 TaxID=573492 RepID=UPI00202B00D4|nr:VOC family protein [Frankia sp. AiPa1]MCL9762125.1 VOC family protein [Frankia sp. AiPa1]
MRTTVPGILRSEDLFHTGIVVDDLEAAREELGSVLGVTWYEGGATVRLRTRDGTRAVSTAYVLSREGTHHVELVQSIEGTLWTAVTPGHAHHLGYWVDDLAGATEALEALGWSFTASIALRDDRPPMCTYLRARGGLHVEIVDRNLLPMLLPAD